MALAALIFAYHEALGPGTLRAALPLASRTLVERQARLAAAAGAHPIVLVVERLPVALVEAVARLRRDRIEVVMARGAGDAAAAIPPDARVLMIADGCLAERAMVDQMASATPPAVIGLPDRGLDDRYERIDAGTRWAGLGVVDADLLRRTIGMLGDWDLQSTLLRRALQAGAAVGRIADPATAPSIMLAPGDLEQLQQRLLERKSAPGAGIVARLLAPLERLVTRTLVATPIEAWMMGAAAVLLSAAGAIFAARGFAWPALVPLLLATPLSGIAERLAVLRMEEKSEQSWWALLLPVFAGGALVALARERALLEGWGMILLAVMTILFVVAGHIETGGRAIRASAFLADRINLTWALVPFAALGLWGIGIAVLFAYAAASFFWAQFCIHGTTG